jgi:hypothetical protein
MYLFVQALMKACQAAVFKPGDEAGAPGGIIVPSGGDFGGDTGDFGGGDFGGDPGDFGGGDFGYKR